MRHGPQAILQGFGRPGVTNATVGRLGRAWPRGSGLGHGGRSNLLVGLVFFLVVQVIVVVEVVVIF